jgi:hypothetical protein
MEFTRIKAAETPAVCFVLAQPIKWSNGLSLRKNPPRPEEELRITVYS